MIDGAFLCEIKCRKMRCFVEISIHKRTSCLVTLEMMFALTLRCSALPRFYSQKGKVKLWNFFSFSACLRSYFWTECHIWWIHSHKNNLMFGFKRRETEEASLTAFFLADRSSMNLRFDGKNSEKTDSTVDGDQWTGNFLFRWSQASWMKALLGERRDKIVESLHAPLLGRFFIKW